MRCYSYELVPLSRRHAFRSHLYYTPIACEPSLASLFKSAGGPNYNGVPCGGSASTIRSALTSAGAAGGFTVNYASGCDNPACQSTSGFAAAVAAAQTSDVTVVAVGLDASFENEGLDRTSLSLPGQQAQLVTSVCAAAKGPCILVLVSGGAVDISPVLPSVSAAWYTGLPGGLGADGFVDLLFGDAVPAGRLTQTFYPASYASAVSLEDMGMRPGSSAFPPGTNPGRTYKWYTGETVFPFGFGLSYTTFAVSNVTGPAQLSVKAVEGHLQAAAAANGNLGATLLSPLTSPQVAVYTVNVTNTGKVDADYAALGFLVPPGAGTGGVPLQELFGFQRVHVPAGQTVTVWLGLNTRHLTRVVEADAANAADSRLKVQRVAVAGRYTVRVGVQGEGQALSEAHVQVQ